MIVFKKILVNFTLIKIKIKISIKIIKQIISHKDQNKDKNKKLKGIIVIIKYL
jgi:hypothetical protein